MTEICGRVGPQNKPTWAVDQKPNYFQVSPYASYRILRKENIPCLEIKSPNSRSGQVILPDSMYGEGNQQHGALPQTPQLSPMWRGALSWQSKMDVIGSEGGSQPNLQFSRGTRPRCEIWRGLWVYGSQMSAMLWGDVG